MCFTNLQAKRHAMSVQSLKCPQVTKESSKSKSQSKKKSNNNDETKRKLPISIVSKEQKTVNVRLMKLSSLAGSKRRPIPQTLLNSVLSMLEDSVNPFTDSGNRATQSILDKITYRYISYFVLFCLFRIKNNI